MTLSYGKPPRGIARCRACPRWVRRTQGSRRYGEQGLYGPRRASPEPLRVSSRGDARRLTPRPDRGVQGSRPSAALRSARLSERRSYRHRPSGGEILLALSSSFERQTQALWHRVSGNRHRFGVHLTERLQSATAAAMCAGQPSTLPEEEIVSMRLSAPISVPRSRGSLAGRRLGCLARGFGRRVVGRVRAVSLPCPRLGRHGRP
jgi:hypothetical protein